MRTKTRLERSGLTWVAGIVATMVVLLPVGGRRAVAVPPKPKLPPIYDAKADGARQIADALIVAKRDNKRVLLQFGANWCVWCHRLHALFKEDPLVSRKLLYEYELVLIDLDTVDSKKHNAEIDARYGSPSKQGLPALVVLDADGKQLTTRETESWEVGDHHHPGKVLAFLTKWQPLPRSAEEALSTALARAGSSSKNIFLYFTAPWCKWCGRMDEYLRREEIAKLFGASYLPVKLDVDRMTGGGELCAKYGGKEDGGIPFFAVLDPKGMKLADSNARTGNIGFPVESQEIAHFMKVIRETGKRLTTGQVTILESMLKMSK